MGHGHHSHPDGPWVHVLGLHHGLAQPVRAVVEVVQHPGSRLLCGCIGGGAKLCRAWDIQHGSRQSFTSEAFTSVLLNRGVQISMDSAGSYMDNVLVERLWRSVKYEEVYLKAYDSVARARAGIATYLRFYNNERPH